MELREIGNTGIFTHTQGNVTSYSRTSTTGNTTIYTVRTPPATVVYPQYIMGTDPYIDLVESTPEEKPKYNFFNALTLIKD